MLLLSFAKLAVPVVALLVAAPLASAELRQGPTGVEYVKRFAPSPGVAGECYYTCPPTLGDLVLTNGETGTEFEVYTACDYSVEVNDGEVVDSCFFFTDTGAPSDEAAGFPNAENCPVDGADASPGCTSAGRRRTLSPLEQTIRSRQYNPKRRAAKQQ